MKHILCPECGCDIDKHNSTGCVNKADDKFTCDCEYMPSDVAAHAVQAAVSEARDSALRSAIEIITAGDPWNVIVRKITSLLAHQDTTPQDVELPKSVSWNEAMQGRERDFNKRYYNNPDGEPKFPHEV